MKRNIPVVFLCTGWQTKREDLKDAWVDFINNNVSFDEGKNFFKGETIPLNMKYSIAELNNSLFSMRKLISSNREAFLVISCAEWAGALELGELHPNCFLRPTSVHRFASSKLGSIQPLLPLSSLKSDADNDGITCIFTNSSMEIPAHLYDVPESVLAEQPLFKLDMFSEKPPQALNLSEVCDNSDTTSSLLLFVHDKSEGKLVIATRKADGERGWISFSHTPHFKIAVLEDIDERISAVPLPPPEDEPNKRFKAGGAVLKSLIGSPASKQAPRQTSKNDIQSNRFYKLAKLHCSEVFSRSNMPEEFQKGVWLARDTGGGWASTCDSFSGDEAEQKLIQTGRHVRQRVSTMFLVSHAHAEDFREMLRMDYRDWNLVECLDLWGESTASCMRQLSVCCSSRSDTPLSRPKVAYFAFVTKHESTSWACLVQREDAKEFCWGPVEEVGKLQEWFETHDPDIVVAIGLEGEVDKGFALGVDKILRRVSKYDGLRNVIHLEAHDLSILDCYVRTTFLNRGTDKGVELENLLVYARKYDLDRTITEGVIQVSYGRGLCNLGDEMGTIKSMNSVYSRWVDRLVGPSIPISAIRSHVKDKYDGGLVISNPNLERISFSRVLELDYAQEYPTIIIALGLSPDNRGVLPEILKAGLADRASIKKEIAALSKLDPHSPHLSVLKAKEQSRKLDCNAASGWLGKLTPAEAKKMTGRGQQALENLATFASGGVVNVVDSAKYHSDEHHHKMKRLKRFIDPEFVCSVVFGDTDSMFVNIPEGKDHTFIPGFLEALKPFLEHQELALAPKRILHGFVPMDGKRYAAASAFELTNDGLIVPHQKRGAEVFSLQRLEDSSKLVTSSLPHTTHAFPLAAKDLMSQVVLLTVTNRKEAAFSLVHRILRTGLRTLEWEGFICNLKVSLKSADSGMARKLEELREWLASNKFPCPKKKSLIPYVRVITDDGSFSGPFDGNTTAHVPVGVFSSTDRVMQIDLNYYVEHFWVRPVGIYLNLKPSAMNALRAAWMESQQEQPTVVFSPGC